MAGYMALVQILQSLVNRQLSAAAAEEILRIVGRIITEYENQAFCFRQEIDRQRRHLGIVVEPDAGLHIAGW